MAKKLDMANALQESLEKISTGSKVKPSPVLPPKGSGGGKLDEAPRVRSRAKNLALYPEDFDKIREIQNAIQKATGEHPNDSLAVRIAIRSTTEDVKSLVSMYQRIRKQDNRFK